MRAKLLFRHGAMTNGVVESSVACGMELYVGLWVLELKYYYLRPFSENW